MSWKTKSSVALACSVALIVSMISTEEENLKISKEGLLFIAQQEGCRRNAYNCSGDTLTIGIGSTTNVHSGMIANNGQIARWFIRDIRQAERDVLRRVNLPHGSVHDMAVSFAFNLGPTNFRRSTFLKKLKAGDYVGACNEFPRWRYVSGRDCRIRSNNCYGIIIRRNFEKEICLHGYNSIN